MESKSHSIGNENFVTMYDGNKHIFPELFKLNRIGKKTFWRIYTIGDQYFRESGLVGGKVKEYAPTVAKPKNVGKANGTTGEIQALLEANSEWKHKKKELYSEDSSPVKIIEMKSDQLRPMLAEKFTERKKYIKYPCAASRKLDGIRCMIYTEEKETIIMSRQGKKYNFLNNIRKECSEILETHNIVLDGELYSHQIPFNAISGAVRSQNKISKYDSQIEFHIFDYYDSQNPDVKYIDRAKLLETLAKKGYASLRFVLYDTVENESEFSKLHSKYVDEGYEGLIIRNLDGLYTLGRRVNDLQKYKEFCDQEYKITNVTQGEGSETGCSIFVCETKSGQEFTIRPRGTAATRQAQFKNKLGYIGKMLTVRYQPTPGEETDVPRFPVGIEVRDYE